MEASDVVLDAVEGLSRRLERAEFIASGDIAVAPSHGGGGTVTVIDANKHWHVRFGDGHFVVVSACEIERGGHEAKCEVQGVGAGGRGLFRTAVFFPERPGLGGEEGRFVFLFFHSVGERFENEIE